MSSTRRSSDGVSAQERFCSAPEFEGDTINGLSAAKRIAIVKDRSIREALWFVQWRSLVPGGLQKLCDELVATFPERVGTPLIRKFERSKRKFLEKSEIFALREECGIYDHCMDELLGRDAKLTDIPVNEWDLSFYKRNAADEAASLAENLRNFCLNPKVDISNGVWFFHDLLGSLLNLRDRSMKAARARLADTAVTREINDCLDFWFARRRMVLIEGVAGIGRSATTIAWCEAHCGLARYVEVPSSSDDRSFFSSIARQLGVARGASFKAQQIKVRVEEMLLTSELMLVFDESQYLWTQSMRPRKTPDRLLWIKSIFDAGTPIALVAHTDFSKWQAHYVKNTLWTDEQFVRRLNRHIVLSSEHSTADMLKIARAHFPDGDDRSLKLLAAYALGTEKKQASGIVEALESARYRAKQDGRTEVLFADIESALTHDHGFLIPAPAEDLHKPIKSNAKPVYRGRKNGKIADFQIRGGRLTGSRITTPIGTT